MYGLPRDVNLSFLHGATLTQVCVGENEVILNLHPEISIMIASSVRVMSGRNPTREIEDAREIGIAALELLGSTVRGAEALPPGTTRITWADGRFLEIFDSWANYESYTIRHGETLIVV